LCDRRSADGAQAAPFPHRWTECDERAVDRHIQPTPRSVDSVSVQISENGHLKGEIGFGATHEILLTQPTHHPHNDAGTDKCTGDTGTNACHDQSNSRHRSLPNAQHQRRREPPAACCS
jgi:hypothetical protein